ncbi:MAG: hypothetical protein MJ141_02195 [Clostridia bacterium]|nr:hypothetical protein [Clostridia bacterium]
MKRTFTQILALLLAIFMILPVRASCAAEKEREGEGGVADTYLAEPVELDLAENELLMDIIEVDGLLRATVGVTSEELTKKYGTGLGTPYQTEYRYFDMEYKEDETKREPTPSFYQIAQSSDPSLGLTVGGEPFLFTDGLGEETYGVQYRLYKDGEAVSDVLNPKGANNHTFSYIQYGARANVVMMGEIPYVWMDYTEYNYELYIKDHFVKSTDIAPNVFVSDYGLMEIGGVPCALLYVEPIMDPSVQAYDWFMKDETGKTILMPLTPNTTQLATEGIELEGEPTGGAFNDGEYGYFFSNGELWRTDGKKSARICDMIYAGVSALSDLRAVRPISDGRIFVVADGQLFSLSESESSIPAERKVYTLGVMNGGYLPNLSLLVSKFNAAGKDCKFAVKEYKNVTKLNLALVSREVDVLLTSDLDALRNYIKQELLVPLDELVPEFFEEGVLLENIVDLTRQDGVCYYLPREFQIYGERVEADLWEEVSKIDTIEDYCKFILENDPNYLLEWDNRSLPPSFIDTLDDWIDRENYTCHFDDGSFEAFLEFCGQGVDFNSPLYRTGNQYPKIENFQLTNLIAPSIFYDVETAKEYMESGKVQTAYVPYPFPTKTYDGYDIHADGLYAVIDKEESREAAREFMKWCFLENVVGELRPDDLESDYCYDWDLHGIWKIPINQAECERYLSRNLAWDGPDKETRLPLEQRMYEDTWKIIREADHFANRYTVLFDVMVEEAYRYIAGTITAKQAADYVQNRVSLYLAEQG